MTKREVIKCVLDGKKPPYVPWSFKFTKEPKEALMQYYDTDDLDPVLGNHILQLGSDIGFFEDLGGDYVRDVFGVVWDRSVDKDIGDVKGCILENPYARRLHVSRSARPALLRRHRKRNQQKARHVPCVQIGFSLYERAWTLRGIENLLMDFYINPQFVNQLLDAICDYNLRQIDKALEYDIDAVYLRRRLGTADRTDHGIRPLERVYLSPPAAHVRPCPSGRKIRDDTQLRRRGRTVRRPDLDRTQLFQPLPARSDGRGRPAGPVPGTAGFPRRSVDAENPALRHQRGGSEGIAPLARTGPRRRLHILALAFGRKRHVARKTCLHS